jgi:hypothetical protein
VDHGQVEGGISWEMAAEDKTKFTHHDGIIIGLVNDAVKMGSVVELSAAAQNTPGAAPINFGLIFNIDNLALLNVRTL